MDINNLLNNPRFSLMEEQELTMTEKEVQAKVLKKKVLYALGPISMLRDK